MKTLVAYTSMTGNTKKVAEAIAGVFGVAAKKCSEIETIDKIDLLIVGSGVYGRKMGPQMQQFLDRLPANAVKKAIVFGTIGGETQAIESMSEILTNKGVEVTGTFYCKGKFLFFINFGHPNSRDMEAARQFAANIKAELGA